MLTTCIKTPCSLATLLHLFAAGAPEGHVALVVFMAFMGMVLKRKNLEASREADDLYWSLKKTHEDNGTLDFL